MVSFNSLCTPAKIYLILAITVFIHSLFYTIKLFDIIWQLIFIPAWTLLLNWLCSKGYTFVSWLILLWPIIFIVIFVGIFVIMGNIKKNDIHR